MTNARDRDVNLLRQRGGGDLSADHGEVILHRVRCSVGEGNGMTFIVEDAVRDERQIGGFGDLSHCLLEGIHAEFSEPDAVTIEHAGTVRGDDHFVGGAADRDRLPAAAESGVLVRFDASGRKEKVSFDRFAIQAEDESVDRLGQRDQAVVICGIMVDDAIAVDDRVSEFRPFFGFGACPVGANRDQDRDRIPGNTGGFEFGQHRRHHDGVGAIAGGIGDRNHHRASAFGQVK